MGGSLGQVLTPAVGIALSPIPIIGVILMLATPRARANGIAFLIGWIIGIAAASTLLLVISGSVESPGSGDSSDTVGVVKLVLGLLLLGLAAKQWRNRPAPGEKPPMPNWMQTIDSFGPPKAAGMAVLLSAVNPKNLLLIAASSAAIASADLSGSDQAISLAALVVVASLGPGIPVGAYLLLGERSKSMLTGLKEWMTFNNGVIMGLICLLIGVKLIGDAIGGF